LLQAVGNEVLSQVDLRIDPCQDFDAFVCGKWRAAHPLLDGQGSVSSTAMVDVWLPTRAFAKGLHLSSGESSPQQTSNITIGALK
jgi:hypothetical protein